MIQTFVSITWRTPKKSLSPLQVWNISIAFQLLNLFLLNQKLPSIISSFTQSPVLFLFFHSIVFTFFVYKRRSEKEFSFTRSCLFHNIDPESQKLVFGEFSWMRTKGSKEEIETWIGVFFSLEVFVISFDRECFMCETFPSIIDALIWIGKKSSFFNYFSDLFSDGMFGMCGFAWESS